MMPMITWSPSLTVGVTQFDYEHQKLIALINELAEAMKQGRSKETIEKTLKGLVRYARTHFANEERMFDRYAYPDSASHKARHAEFVAAVAGFQNRMGEESAALSVDVLDFLSRWLVTHIEGVDRKYGPFLAAKGLGSPVGASA